LPTRLAKYALAPVLAAQGIALRRRALILPEPDGPRAGVTGNGAPLRLLILGDSSAAGVGASHQNEALSGRLVAALSPHRRVHWQLEARTGRTTAQALRHVNTMPESQFDVVVTALGVNDVTSGMARRRWLRQQANMLATLRSRYGAGRILVTGVPPLGRFPLLPPLLRRVLGAEARRFDAGLAALCAGMNGVRHMPFDLDFDPAQMARDGFHPGPPAYAAWSAALAEVILEDVK